MNRSEMENIASADNSDSVTLFKECYCSLFPITSSCFTTLPAQIDPTELNQSPSQMMSSSSSSSSSSSLFAESSSSRASTYYDLNLHLGLPLTIVSQTNLRGWVGTITSALLCQYLRPTSIRYLASSRVTGVLANEVTQFIAQNKDIWAGRSFRPATLLIFDRREDPVTPLLFSVCLLHSHILNTSFIIPLAVVISSLLSSAPYSLPSSFFFIFTFLSFFFFTLIYPPLFTSSVGPPRFAGCAVDVWGHAARALWPRGADGDCDQARKVWPRARPESACPLPLSLPSLPFFSMTSFLSFPLSLSSLSYSPWSSPPSTTASSRRTCTTTCPPSAKRCRS